MKQKVLFVILSALSFTFGYGQPPQEMAQNFNGTGYIQNIKPEEKLMIVNFVDEKENIIFHKTVKLDDAVYSNEKKKPLTINDLNSSDQVTIIGDKFSKYCAAKQVILLDKKLSAKRNGRIDYINGDLAIVDGIKVKLKPKTVIKGKKKSGFAGREYKSLTDGITPGVIASINGDFDNNNYITSDDFVIAPDNDDKYDQQATAADQGNYAEFYPLWSDKSKRIKLFNRKIDGIGTIVNDAELQDYVNTIGNSLVPEYLKSKTNFIFIVVDNPELTANIRANGLAYVYTGLLKALDNEAQLAAVLGHEITHVMYKHNADELGNRDKIQKQKESIQKNSNIWTNFKNETLKFLSKSKKENLKPDEKQLAIINKLDAINTSDAIEKLKNTFYDKRVSNYSIEQELQADRVGLALMVLANYDPREAPIMWKNLISYTESEEESQDKMDIGKALKDNYSKDPKKKGDPKTKGKPNTSATNAPTADDHGITLEKTMSFFVNWKTEDNIAKSYRTHPDGVQRFEELNQLVATLWDSEDIYKNAQNTNAKKYLAMKKKLKTPNKSPGKK